MTTRTDDSATPLIEGRDDLLAVFSGGEKPRNQWLIGTEHEKFVYRLSDHRAPSYDEPGGIRDLLNGMTEFGWRPVIERAARPVARAATARVPSASAAAAARTGGPTVAPAPGG